MQQTAPAQAAAALFPPKKELQALPLNSLGIVARSFTSLAECSFCNRKLPSGVAYFLKFNALRLPTGPECASKWGADSHGTPVPDFTGGLLSSRDLADDPRAALNDPRRPGEMLPAHWRENAQALEYALLRNRFLRGKKVKPNVFFVGLEDACQQYEQKGQVSERALRSVKTTMNKPDTPPIFGYRALMTTFAYLHLGDRALAQTDEKLKLQDTEQDRLKGILGQLRDRMWLTATQGREAERMINRALPKTGRRRNFEFDYDAYAPIAAAELGKRGLEGHARTHRRLPKKKAGPVRDPAF